MRSMAAFEEQHINKCINNALEEECPAGEIRPMSVQNMNENSWLCCYTNFEKMEEKVLYKPV